MALEVAANVQYKSATNMATQKQDALQQEIKGSRLHVKNH